MAKPIPLPLGRADPHILESNGAETNIMNFYVTSYSTSFVKPSITHNKSKYSDIPAYTGAQTFIPRSAPENKGTGFVSNVRPQIFYKESMDKIDNPELRRICSENYETMAQRQFRPFALNNGNEDLPVKVVDQNSAFTKYIKVHNARPADVADLYINTKSAGPVEVLPRHLPLLYKLKHKDTIPKENFDHGVKYMSTEYNAHFENPDQPRIDKTSAIGPKELSGFVTNQESDTLTAIPGERWLYNTRNTGVTNYQDKFPSFNYPHGNESLANIPGLKIKSDTGHARSILPQTEVNPRSSNFGNPTEYDTNYLGVQRPAPTKAQNLNSAYVGPKEDTSRVIMEKGFEQKFDDPRRFVTNYQTRFIDTTPKGRDREGYIVGGVNGSKTNGFTSNTNIHEPGIFNPDFILKNAQPYQSKSILARDRFYDDQHHRHKFNSNTNEKISQDNNPYSVKISCT